MATEFQILGPLRITVADSVEVDVGGPRPAAVLAMLLVRPNELVSADRLIDDLWDGQPPATAAKTLQVHISRLRRALAEAQNGDGSAAIVTRGRGYVLEVEPERIDGVRFERLVAEGTGALADEEYGRASSRLRSALALWRGDALADFTYASFAQDAIARFDGLRGVAQESAVDAELKLGRHTELIPELKSLVQRNPLSERVRGQLMLALYRAGRQAEALGVYRAGRRVLVDQLGIEPSEELREIERAILAQDPELAGVPVARPRRDPSARAARAARGAIVGYERELSALEELLESALVGRGGVALIAGEPGIGKTRLVEELASVAQLRSALVLTGRCWSGSGAPVYWPWVQVLRALVADRDPGSLRTELGSRAAELAPLLPELADVATVTSTPGPASAEDARFRLFDAFGSALKRAATGRPLVIVLDDIHAADSASLELLQFMAGPAVESSILIVATYRDTEGASLTQALSELARASDCLQLVLTGLSAADTAHLVEVSANVEPMPRLAEAIHDASGGNPLFVSELVRLLRTEGRLRELRDDDELVLPRGVDGVIQRRIDGLPGEARATLAVAAVVGREFQAELVARATGEPPAAVLDDVEAAIAIRVVEQVGDKRYRFAHDLIRQTLYDGLGGTERSKLHLAVATAVEAMNGLPPAPVAATLAHHYSEALPEGDPTKAVDYLRLAAEQALNASAYNEASALLERAAETARAHGFHAELMCELYLQLAETLVALMTVREARAALGKAETIARELPADETRDARIAVVRAYDVLLDGADLSLDEVYAAIELFKRTGDAAGEARGWEVVAMIRCGGSKRTQELAAAKRMLECADAAKSPGLVGRALRTVASALVTGPLPISQVDTELRALLARAPNATVRSRLTVARAYASAIQGHFDEARARLAEAWTMLPATERVRLHEVWVVYGVRVETLAENLVRAEELGRELADIHRRSGLMAYFASEAMFLADALVAQGRLDEARDLIDEAAPWTADDDVDALFRQARTRARIACTERDFEAAEAAARASIGHLAQAETTDDVVETMLVLAQVLHARGRHAEATDTAATALRLAEQREHAVYAARARRMLEGRVAA